jgi:hypothetical protein
MSSQELNLMSSYKVITVPDSKQSSSDLGFKGGIPNIPHEAKIPNCKLCKSPMTFFLQIVFPKDHIWDDKVMVFSHCTSCYDVDNYWPKTYYTRGQEHYPLIPDGFLDSYSFVA